ncbi:MAG: MmcQ/YjbR family DNA-binding protein [Acidobacteriota bacterium]
MPKRPNFAKIAADLRDAALCYPGTDEHFPWGETAIKVKGKTFLFMRSADDELSLSVKLPQSREDALALPFTEPTHYGLGKSGWVTSSFKRDDEVPVGVLKDWIDESYRAVAPKKLLAQLPALG